MEILSYLINLILHMDQHLIVLATHYGLWLYVILFLIIFCETGLVVMPFLPGDSLLFATGALTAGAQFNLSINLLFVVLASATILGNTLNYTIGSFIGDRVLDIPKSRWFNPHYLQRAHQFYEVHGGKAIIIGRFLPIVRTFVPFVAGIGEMQLKRFMVFNAIGAMLWVGILLYTSFWFGNLSIVKENFSIVIMGVIGVSLMPAVIGALKARAS